MTKDSMPELTRRSLLKGSSTLLLPKIAFDTEVGGGFKHFYGKSGDRLDFRQHWQDLRGHSFEHGSHPGFHCLTTSPLSRYSRCERPLSLVPELPVWIAVKCLSYPGSGRALLTIGLKSESHGNWAFTLGAATTRQIQYEHVGWHVAVNAANPWEERTEIAGLDHRDWHTFALFVPGRNIPARLYCDGHFVMELEQPISPSQRDEVNGSQWDRHGSVRQIVPEIDGEGTYLFIEGRNPYQTAQIDSFQASQTCPATKRKSLPVLLDSDWELRNMLQLENPIENHSEQPLLPASAIAAITGAAGGASDVGVAFGQGGYNMYFSVLNGSGHIGDTAAQVLYRAESPDGNRWTISPRSPVLEPDPNRDAWDGGSLAQVVVVREGQIYRMWYAGYSRGMQQGRTGYAESVDGIVWTKPLFENSRFEGRATNVAYGLQPGFHTSEYELPVSLVADQYASPERKYVLFLHSQGPHGFIVDVAVSSDGFRFQRAPHNARHYGFDSQPLNARLHPAAVVFSESGYYWAIVGHHTRRADTPSHDEKGYQLQFTGWTTEPDERENPSLGLWKPGRSQLEGRPSSWETGQPRVGCVLEVGDEWWFFYVSAGSIGLAKVGKHRVYGLGLSDGAEDGSALTLGLEQPADGWAPYTLAINVTGLHSGARVSAELLVETGAVIEGFELESSLPVTTDGYRQTLEWRNKGARLTSCRGTLRARIDVKRGAGTPQVHALYLLKDI